MSRHSKIFLALSAPLAVAACGGGAPDPRGVDRSETLLSVSASGDADARPDEAFFIVGVENFGRDAAAASAANRTDIAELLSALKAAGVPEKDIQTRSITITLIDWGPRRGQYQASNTVAVTVRDIAKADAAIAAATEAGANIMSGPELRMSDPEAAANSAYAAAYANARKRAEAYAAAAGMEVSRVLYIRDAGGSQGERYLQGAAEADGANFEARAAVPTSVIMPGETTSSVTVQVDFALRET